MYQIKKIERVDEMHASLALINELTPELREQDYRQMLPDMVAHNYRQVGVYEGDRLVAVSGYWIGTKLYCGRYLEIDNFVVSKEHRSRNLGKMLVEWMQEEARREQCRAMLLDAYVENFRAHKFYYSQGFIARGYHYLKWL
jgi:GNAT superfamily N-acetyltransferase